MQECRSESSVKKLLLFNVFSIESSSLEQWKKRKSRASKFWILGVLKKKWTEAPSSFCVMSVSCSQISAAVNLGDPVHGPGRVPGQNPYCLFSTPATGMISAAQLKGKRGPLTGPEIFKVKPLHLVSVLIDHRHIIFPVRGLICPANQHRSHLLGGGGGGVWEGESLLLLHHSWPV